MRFWRVLVVVLVVLALGAGALFATGTFPFIVVWLAQPWHGWDLARKAPAPDYALDASWAARPGLDSPALFVPAGVENLPGERAVDVFFVHPTGYLNGGDWIVVIPYSRVAKHAEYDRAMLVLVPRHHILGAWRFVSAAHVLIVLARCHITQDQSHRRKIQYLALTYFFLQWGRVGDSQLH